MPDNTPATKGDIDELKKLLTSVLDEIREEVALRFRDDLLTEEKRLEQIAFRQLHREVRDAIRRAEAEAT